MSKTIHSSNKTQDRVDQTFLPITKSNYLQYLACAPEFWYLKHYPEEFSGAPDEEALHIMRQGNAIESLARDYFKPSEDLHIAFQRDFQSDRLLARADIVLREISSGIKTLVEVKSGTEVKDEYIDDLAFQVIAAEEVGVKIDRVGVLHINNDYVRSGDIDIMKLFLFDDITELVLERIPATRERIEAAIKYLAQDEPVVHLLEYCGQKLGCPAIQQQHPDLPAYSVFNISRISQPKLNELLERGIVDIQQVPRDFKLTDKQRLQVDVAQAGVPHIQHQSIRESLDTLRFPLYFLDYETLQFGIPLYNGVKPYQQMVFQWSLHKLLSNEQEPIHLEYLSDGRTHPSLEFVRTLHGKIPYDNGSIIVWNKAFEMTRNKELASMYPDFEPFLSNINSRIFDLMEIFQKQLFVHPRFRGSNSIKDVLPVLAPHLTYADLEINQGMLASIRWFEIVTDKILESEKQRVLHNLRQYCKLDTLAMVEVYKHLRLVTSITS